ncbi:MAG: peptidyl-prolyl cis-trans isomerase [Sedimentisphaerales bacterium]|nr:peptidyl-prolyl cis-trans isomerase [Sedimentisphaerales bacterium]
MPQEQSRAQTDINPQVLMKTSLGEIVIELNVQSAPITVDNFLGYVKEGFYDGTIFHRVIPTFMIQGGGFTQEKQQKSTHAPIKNESSNGLKNLRGTIAMARTNDPDSATCQFFINVVDNAGLDYEGPRPPGYAVFGEVVEGMDVVDAIRSVATTNRGGAFANDPVEAVVIESVKLVE